MTIRVSSDRLVPVEDHLIPLHNILRRLAISLFFTMAIWTYFVDDLISSWTLSHSPSGALSVYGPYDWLEIRWSAIIILAVVTVLPIFCYDMRRYIRPGLLAEERKWLDFFLLGNIFTIPLILWYVWFSMIPTYVDGVSVFDSIENVSPRYDAKEIFSLASGISWIVIVGFVATFSTSLARLLGFLDISSTFSSKIYLICGGLLILTLPDVFEGIRVIIAVSSMAIADAISRTIPSAPIGAKRFDISSKQALDGTIQRLAILDCSCEGASPPIPSREGCGGVAFLNCTALCLERNEQDALIEMALRYNLTQFVLTGCDGSPVPKKVHDSLYDLNIHINGLSWMDESKAVNEKWRSQSLSLFLSQYNESSDN